MPDERRAISGVVACPSCGCLTLARRRRCWRCNELLPFAYVRNERLEQQIDLAAVTGVAVAVVLLCSAVMLWFEDHTRGLWIASVAVVLGLSHLTLRWFRAAWLIALAAWTVLTVMAALMLRGDATLAVIAVAASFCWLALLQLKYRQVVPYLEGETPDAVPALEPSRHGRCERCTRLAPSAVAPLWCVSLLFMTSVTIGKPKYLCLVHARRNAVAASVFSAVFGWWGLPWGLIRTPEVLWKNLSSGGQIVESAMAQRLYEAQGTGHAGWFNFFPGIRSKPIAVIALLLFMFIIFGSVWMYFFVR